MSTEIIKHCDVCGKTITKSNVIKTPWYTVAYALIDTQSTTTFIMGDGCRDCYKSFCEWKKTRHSGLFQMLELEDKHFNSITLFYAKIVFFVLGITSMMIIFYALSLFIPLC